MASTDLDPVIMRIDGLGTEEAGVLASRAVTEGAIGATIKNSERMPPSLLLTIAWPDSGEANRASSVLITMLRFAAEAEGVDVEVLLNRARGR
jgi:hypothetical protein